MSFMKQLTSDFLAVILFAGFLRSSMKMPRRHRRCRSETPEVVPLRNSATSPCATACCEQAQQRPPWPLLFSVRLTTRRWEDLGIDLRMRCEGGKNEWEKIFLAFFPSLLQSSRKAKGKKHQVQKISPSQQFLVCLFAQDSELLLQLMARCAHA